jgi:hypothetical protein
VDGAEEGPVKRFPGAQVVSSTNFRYEGRFPARDFVLRIPSGVPYRYHAWLIPKGGNLYLVAVAGPREFIAGDDAAKFFKSFHFLDDGK